MSERVVDWEALRAPFPPEQIGKLPKVKRDDGNPESCSVCGGYHAKGAAALHLDYVGHAWLTERLNNYGGDWELVRVDGPNFPDDKLVWMEAVLTIDGVRRSEVGCALLTKEEWPKLLWSDVLTRCAMRHGIGLAMWQKDTPVGEDRDPPRGGARGAQNRSTGGVPRGAATVEPLDSIAAMGVLRGRVGELGDAGKAAWEEWKAGANWEANRQAETLGSSGLLEEALVFVAGLLEASATDPF